MAILCTNALVVALNRRKPILKGQQILIDQGVIVEVGKCVMASGFHIEERLDCSGKIVVRGGRLTRVREEKVIRKVEPISKRMRRLYGMIARNRPDSAESVIRKLYRRVFKEEKRPRFILH